MRLRSGILALFTLAALPSVARAGYKLIPAAQTATVTVSSAPKSIIVLPSREWNSLNGFNLAGGKYIQSWTIDGASLNDLRFYVGVPDNAPLFREISKSKKPLPHFSSTMLAPDIAQLLEESYRIATDTSLFKMDSIEPAQFAGFAGFHFAFTYTVQEEEVRRKGEATGAIIDGKLYMITFAAPTLHYYNHDLAAYRAIVDSAKLVTASAPN